MLFEKTSVIDVFILLFQENLKSDCNTGNDALTRTDRRLSFDTGSPGNKDNVKWTETISVQSAKILFICASRNLYVYEGILMIEMMNGGRIFAAGDPESVSTV